MYFNLFKGNVNVRIQNKKMELIIKVNKMNLIIKYK